MYIDNIMRKLLILMFMSIFLVGCSSLSTEKIQVIDGFSTINLEDGSQYSGLIKNGKPHGYGKTVTRDGAIYEGEHVNGMFHGYGKLTLSDGSYFMGYMKHNKVSSGTMNFTDGKAITIDE